MRRAPLPLLLLVAVALTAATVPVFAAEEGGATGLATPTPPRGDLHLRTHHVRVILNNGFATTEVNQVLVNPTDTDVEAEWAFPLPKEGSLSELAISIGEEMVVGEVVEKAEARRIFDAEKSAGRDTALMEQNAFYDYRIALARVPALGEVKVRIVYFQPLDIDAGVGRYLYPLQEGNTDDMKQSFWTMSKEVNGDLTFDVTLKTAFPVDGLHCPSHPGFRAGQIDERTWEGRWASSSVALDRDFALYYRLAPDVPARVELLTHRREGAPEGTFMAVVTPGSDLAPVEHGTDWAFVLDVSGSMQGEKIRVLQRGVERAITGLGSQDRVHVIAFNQSAWAVTKGWTAEADRPEAVQAVGTLSAGGSTNIHAALELAYRSLDADRPAAVILVSDGVANTGPHDYRSFIELARKHDVRLFTFVMGNSANERLLGDLATLSHGFAKSVSVQDEIGAHLLLAKDRMSHEAMHGVDFRLDGAVVQHPKTLPSLYLGQQLVVFGRYEQTGPSTLEVSAKISGEAATWKLPVDLPAVAEANPELERLYGLAAISDLEREAFLRTGDGGEAKDAIVDLAIRYSLVTDYTSMIVVRPEQKADYGIGDDNANRRKAEREAAARRAREGNAVQTVTGGTPLAGVKPAHAPSRAAQRRPQGDCSNGSGRCGSSSGGGGGGSGAVGPLYLIPAIGLAWLAVRRRRRTKA